MLSYIQKGYAIAISAHLLTCKHSPHYQYRISYRAVTLTFFT